MSRRATITPVGRRDTAAVVAEVLVPLVARGVIVRRPRVVSVLERRDADRRAVDRMRALRERYGPDPVVLSIPGRDVVLVLSAGDATRLLDASPVTFSPSTTDKRAALSHFQPAGVLISEGDERRRRRRLNEQALGDGVAGLVTDAASAAVDRAGAVPGDIDWNGFRALWWPTVLQVVFGPAAARDTELVDDLERLRRAANWAYLRPRRRRLRAHVLGNIAGHRRAAPPTSLAGRLHDLADSDAALDDQIAHWLFAFDAAAIAAFRALTVVAAGRSEGSRASTRHESMRRHVLESLRLWPTTPLILREQLDDVVAWPNGATTAGTSFALYAPLFHRDVDDADAFRPDRWSDDLVRLGDDDVLVPFSGGPAICPGRDVALDVAAAVMAAIAPDDAALEPAPGTAPLGDPLPSVLDPFHRAVVVTRR